MPWYRSGDCDDGMKSAMDLSSQPLFQMMKERMGYLGQRQKVLAQNVANADTPGYRPSDLKPMNFQAELRATNHQLAPVQTQSNHLPPVTPVGGFKTELSRKTYETSPSGNGVVLEEQMMKISETQGDYGLTTSLYRKYLDMMKMALSR
jgi:flagellar basal-body rod protein FlgB